MVKIYRKSVSLSALWVSSNERLSDFYASSWQRGESPIPMLVFRILLAGVALAILVWSLVEAPNPYWLIYLTNWGLLLVVGMLLCGMIVSFEAIYNKPHGELLNSYDFNCSLNQPICCTTLLCK